MKLYHEQTGTLIDTLLLIKQRFYISGNFFKGPNQVYTLTFSLIILCNRLYVLLDVEMLEIIQAIWYLRVASIGYWLRKNTSINRLHRIFGSFITIIEQHIQ